MEWEIFSLTPQNRFSGKLAEFLPEQAFRQETAEYLMESCIFHRVATAATAGTDFNINPFTFHLYYIYFPARSHVHAV